MKGIIELVAVVALFIFFFYFLYKLYLKSDKKEVKAKEEKPVKKDENVDKKEDIPEILKEVTMGNYMYDISKTSKSEPTEVSFEKPEKDSEFDIDKVFESINSQELEDVQIEEIEDDLMEDIGVGVDDVILEVDDEDVIKSQKRKSLAEEYAELSGNMKALIIANVLDKKHHNK